MKTFDQFINESLNKKKYPEIVYGLANERKNRENNYEENNVVDDENPYYMTDTGRSHDTKPNRKEKELWNEQVMMLDEIYDLIEKKLGNPEDIVFIGTKHNGNDKATEILLDFYDGDDVLVKEFESSIDVNMQYRLYYDAKDNMCLLMNWFGSVDYYNNGFYISKESLKKIWPISKVTDEVYKLINGIYTDEEKRAHRGAIKLKRYSL